MSLLLKWVDRTRRSSRVSFLRNVRLFKASLSNESISKMNSRSSLVSSFGESFEDVVEVSRGGAGVNVGVIVISSSEDFIVTFASLESFESDLLAMFVVFRLKRFSIFCQNFISPNDLKYYLKI